jgi:hypothetical protein
MKKTAKKKTKKISADDIATMADKGKSVSSFFSNAGSMKKPIQRVNVDFVEEMLEELDAIANQLNISRQAVIKSYLRQALDQHYLAKSKAS